ncbi:MAG TPA: aminotransferase class I/II-fold pyridoxal phosphate-dependent enzyme [Actinomycetota bacterium]|nr:aminotransferase class I/II-fold pyridoxal phosphate-dependent enzyme [Actinomycetota bacterium]
MEERGFTTRSLRAAADARGAEPLSVPIYQTATFAFDDAEVLAEWIRQGKDAGHVYTRWNNPTREALERALADLERGDGAVSFSSGMAAITTTLAALVQSGDHVVSSPDLYGGAFSTMTKLLPRWGVDVTLARSHRSEDMLAEIRPGTVLCYTESIGNPRVSVPDLSALADGCRERGVTTVVDNTFASPYLCTPRAFGIDVVVHSTTKYIGGHSDLTGGIAVTDVETHHRIRETSIDLGGVSSPFEAWLALRGLQTLALRMERHCANAQMLAEMLERHEKVTEVWYPGLPSHPDHDLATRQMRGASGMLAFELAGGLEAGRRFMEAVEVARVGASLGSTHTLVVHPPTVTHTQMTAEERHASGISDGIVRVSVGIEDPEDVLEDFERALEKA